MSSVLNILVPIASKSSFFEQSQFPKPMIEVSGVPMIQYVVDYLSTIKRKHRFIFVVRREDCTEFHLDDILRLVTNSETIVIKQNSEAQGAACSCLLAIDHIDNDAPLIISNGDQFIDTDIEESLQRYDAAGVDAGLLCFESVHPKWSYAKLDARDHVLETAEKHPISKNAIAGFYYFRRGGDFVEAAKRSIMMKAQVNGLYYVAPTYNELVLQGKSILALKLEKRKYHSFYSLEKIDEFEQWRRSVAAR